MVLNATSGMIETPPYPFADWLILVPTGQFIEIKIIKEDFCALDDYSCGTNDDLRIYDGPSAYSPVLAKKTVFGIYNSSGISPRYLISSTNMVFIQFTVEYESSFILEYKSRDCKCLGVPCDKDGSTCASICEAGWYGEYCQEPCECQQQGSNGQSCDRDTGKCSCKDGWWNDKCESCSCKESSTTGEVCNKETGACICKPGEDYCHLPRPTPGPEGWAPLPIDHWSPLPSPIEVPKWQRSKFRKRGSGSARKVNKPRKLYGRKKKKD